MNTTPSPTAKEQSPSPTNVVRLAVRAFRRRATDVTELRALLHVNCACRLASTLVGTYDGLDEARARAREIVPNGPRVGQCSLSQPLAEVPADTPMAISDAKRTMQGPWPTADHFESHRDDDGGFLGYTFQVGRINSAAFGWITPTGTYAKGLEPYRSYAAALLPIAVRDEQARAQHTERR
ncbi:hypothetical protein [Streptomyces sp. NPDC001948]